MISRFHIGEKVIVKDCYLYVGELRGCIGTVVGFGEHTGSPAVEFPFAFPQAHSCQGLCKTGNGLYISDASLDLAYDLDDRDPTEEDCEYAERIARELEEMFFCK